MSNSEFNAAISEARKSILDQMAECKNQYFMSLGIEFMVKTGKIWDKMNKQQRRVAMEFVHEIQRLGEKNVD